ncbi:hypothetical protein J6590_061497 [Homalodisca vitripennis]|nr:hypothetical protein J6590_061497 [Homalodisca vitripennis]
MRVDFKCPEIRVKQRLVNQRTMEQLRNTLAAQDWARVIEANTETLLDVTKSSNSTTEEDVMKIIEEMKPKTSAGEDQISSKIMKCCKNEIIGPLTNLINKFLSEGVLPSCLKTHLTYGLAVWGSTSATNFQRVLVSQKRAMRELAGLKPKDTCREAFKELKILTITSMYIREVILQAVQSDEALFKTALTTWLIGRSIYNSQGVPGLEEPIEHYWTYDLH